MSLAVHPCRSLCSWAATGERHRTPDGDLPLFACAGCGTQWARDQGWAPRQADGTWPPGVREELSTARAEDGAGTGGS